MARFKGHTNIGIVYNPTHFAPLDTRMLVGRYSDLTDRSNWVPKGYTEVSAYNGMIVSVGSDPDLSKNGLYRLFDKNNPGPDDIPDVTKKENWYKVSDISELGMYQKLHDDSLVTDDKTISGAINEIAKSSTKVIVEGQRVLEFDADSKFDKSGGTITGDLEVEGNLYVVGTTVTKDTETIRVKDNIIVANSDGVELDEKSGFAIKTDYVNSYGIMYDPIDDGVKIGLGSFDGNGKFTYTESEDQLLATRESDLPNGYLVSWDSEKKTLSKSNLMNGIGNWSIAQVGGKASATGEGAVALNGGYKAEENGTETEGVRAFGKWSIAGGKDTEAYQRCTVAIGGGNKAGLTLEEFNEKYPNGTDPHGKTYEESYSFATAEGVDNKATGYGAHAENERNIASGKNSHASGQETEATGDMSFSTGYKTYATASKSFTMGDNTHAEGIGSFAQGYGGHAKGNWSIVLGESCEATKDSAVAGGKHSKATGVSSLAFGGLGISAEQKPTKAGNEYAIALGRGAQATGVYQSTAIGLDVTASGNASLAMGWNSKATKLSSVAIGQDCESNGERSMTVGWGNKTNIFNQFVCGTFCIENTPNALLVVGNGNGTNDRSNALEVLKDGRAKVYGEPKDPQDVLRLKDIENLDLANYQTKTDDNLTTLDKTIVGAINELNGLSNLTEERVRELILSMAPMIIEEE